MSEQILIYPPRPASHLDEVIEQLDERPNPKLTEEQVADVLAFEHNLYENSLSPLEFPGAQKYLDALVETGRPIPTLEEIWRKKINTSVFGLSYFLTDQGRQTYESFFAEPLTASTYDEVEAQLRKHDLTKYKSKELNKLAGNSVEAEEDRVVNEFAAREFRDVEDVDSPHTISILKKPGVLVEKAQGYRMLKKYIKAVETDIKDSFADDTQAVQEAKMFIAGKYRQRINQFLAGLYPDAYSLLLHYRATKDEQTARQLEELKSYIPAFNYSRADRETAGFLEKIDYFMHGVANDTEGNLTVVDPEVDEFLQRVDKQIQHREVDRGSFSGLSPDQIADLEIDTETTRRWAADVLVAWGILSVHEDYDSDRDTRAPDGKWQAVTSEKFTSLAVSGKQAVVKIPLTKKNRKVTEVVPVLSHEAAHVQQNESKRRLGRLALMEEVGMESTSAFLEAGAKWWESEARERLTGESDDDIAGTSYLEAIKVRLQGGDFAECMQAFFEDFCHRKPELPKRDAAKRAVNRTRRIFRSGGKFTRGTNHLTNSQPLNYLEQELIVAKLPDRHKKLLLLGSVTLKTAITLRNMGLLDLASLEEPKPLPWDVLAEFVREKLST